jgi:hypothetical protein
MMAAAKGELEMKRVDGMVFFTMTECGEMLAFRSLRQEMQLS